MPEVTICPGQQLANPEGGVYEAGEQVDLGDAEAADAIAMGVAVAKGDDCPEPIPQPEQPEVEPGEAVDGAVGESGVQEAEDVPPPAAEPEPAPEATDAGPVRPSTADPKADWEAYVTALGGDPTDLTKVDLIAEADRLEAG